MDDSGDGHRGRNTHPQNQRCLAHDALARPPWFENVGVGWGTLRGLVEEKPPSSCGAVPVLRLTSSGPADSNWMSHGNINHFVSFGVQALNLEQIFDNFCRVL